MEKKLNGSLFNMEDKTPLISKNMSNEDVSKFSLPMSKSHGSPRLWGGWAAPTALPKSNSPYIFNTPSLNLVYTSPQVELNKLKDDLKLLDEIASCSVCLERLRASVVCCVNGHAVCEGCGGKLTQCPTCSLAFSKDKFTVLSQLLEALPQCCQHEGCTQVTKKKQEHEAWCGYRQVQCRECDWKGTVRNLQCHIRSHVTNIIQVNSEKDCCLSLDGSKNHSMYVTAHNQLFWLVQKYVPEEAKMVIELTWLPDGLINHDMFEMKAEFEKDMRKFKSVTNVHFEPSGDDVSARFVFNQEMLQFFTENGSIKYKFVISINS